MKRWQAKRSLPFPVLFSGLGLLAAACTLVSVSGFYGERGFWWDLGSHFRWPCFLLQGAFIALFSLLHTARATWRWRSCVLLVFVGLGWLLNLQQILPFYVPQPKIASHGRPLRVLHLNVLGPNRDSAAVITLIRRTEPDLLTLAEYNPWWQGRLRQSGVLNRFAGRYVVPYGNDGVYARFPFERAHVRFEKPSQDPTVRLDFRWDGRPVTLLVGHPRPPVKPAWYARQRRQFARWETLAPHAPQNVLLIGDLNTGPWSYPYRRLLQVSGLRDSQTGFGLQPTWPAMIPAKRFKLRTLPLIPIDHVLVSKHWVVLAQQTGPYVGSDHLPVLTTLALR